VDRGDDRLPETDNGRLVGIVTRAEFVRAYLRRDDEILRTIREDVIQRTMWLDPDDLRVKVRERMVGIAGTVGRRSTATIFEKLIGGARRRQGRRELPELRIRRQRARAGRARLA